MIEIRLAQTPEEREQVFKLRYNIYVEEMGKKPYYADCKLKILEEPLDSHAKIFAAYQNGQVIGTIRNNLAISSNLEYYSHLYKMYETVGDAHPHHTSITTKFMIKKEFRGSTLFRELFRSWYKHLLNEGVKFDFADCAPRTTILYQKLGYQVIGEINHPEYGYGNLLMFNILDFEHLKKVNSPLTNICQKFFDLQREVLDKHIGSFLTNK